MKGASQNNTEAPEKMEMVLLMFMQNSVERGSLLDPLRDAETSFFGGKKKHFPTTSKQNEYK